MAARAQQHGRRVGVFASFWLALCAIATLSSVDVVAAEFDTGLTLAPHTFSNSNELGQPEGWTGGIGNTLFPGLRFAVFPVRQFGFEIEGGATAATMATVDKGSQSVLLIQGRAHGVLRATYGPVQILAVGGAGLMNISNSAGDRFAKEYDPFGYGGLGVAYNLGEAWRLRLDGRMHFTPSTAVGKFATHEYEAMIGFSWHFGKAAPLFEEPDDDIDHDGIPDVQDICPYDAETKNGVRDEDGCPENPEVAKRYHQTQYVKRDDTQLAVLPRAARGEHVEAPKPAKNAAPIAATPTPTAAEDKMLAALETAAPLAENALPPLVGPGDDDHDGINRADDVCPDNAEDDDGFEDLDGCPDPDNDQDGILDAADLCPFEAETKNGVRDEDGCPEHPTTVQRYHQTRFAKAGEAQVAVLPEKATVLEAPAATVEEKKEALDLLPAVLPLAPNALPPLVSAGDDDHDGLDRAADVCPDRAEDADKFEDGDGCPDPDNDQDGVPDAKDKCPLEGETRNGYDDEDGCPDDIPRPLAERVGVLQGVVFEKGSVKIADSSLPVLTKVRDVLVRYPKAKVEISGHTDDTGARDKNVELSRLRAESVRTWLVDHGADGTRITAVGYGPDKPKVPNKSAKARGINRRVEFNLVTDNEPVPLR